MLGTLQKLAPLIACACNVYHNDFELQKKNIPVHTPCGNTNLDQTSINNMYGAEGEQFGQNFTVATVKYDSNWNESISYANPEAGIVGNYGIGIPPSSFDTSLLGLYIKVPESNYLNVQMDISAIDVNGCGGPFNTNSDPLLPRFKVKLTDTDTNTVIGSHEVTGEGAPNQWTYNWTRTLVTFNKTSEYAPQEYGPERRKLSEQNIRIEWEALPANGYSVFDNLIVFTSETPPTALFNPSASGDPHIKTWNGEMYDFHGACDLVLLQNPSFGMGIGMDIHIRTKSMLRQWSYISAAVLRIGENTFEVAGGRENRYWIDGVVFGSLEKGVAGRSIGFEQLNSHSRLFVVDLGGGESITFKTWKDFVRVDLVSASHNNFGNSLGLLGSFGTGHKIGRDKSTVFGDANEFGLEWQVLPEEPMLFHGLEGVQAPTKCAMPDSSKTRHRRLGEAAIGIGDAEIACARVEGTDRDACVFDVLATNDKDVAGAY